MPVPIVVEEGFVVVGKSGQDQVEISVIVIVADINSHARLLSPIRPQGHPRSQGGLGELAVAVVVKQIVG